MIRALFSSLLVLFTLRSFAQQAELPAVIKAPEGSTLVLKVYAKGVQVYVCKPDAADTNSYKWIFVEPRANLYTDGSYKTLAGKHYYNSTKSPEWKLNDGSTVSGAKLQQAVSPDGLAIPWLLLKTVSVSGNGQLNGVAYIQRINTQGGSAPKTADGTQKGKLLEVPYTAAYVFYR